MGRPILRGSGRQFVDRLEELVDIATDSNLISEAMSGFNSSPSATLRWISLIVSAGMLLGAADARKQQSCRFVIDWNASAPERGRTVWLAYLMYRVAHAPPTNDCQSEGTVVVPSFDQEVQARDATLKTYLSLKQRDAELDLPYFNDLSRVAAAGFLREYVWVYLRQKSWPQEPSGLRVSEFEIWREANLKGHVPQTQVAVKVVAGSS